MAYTTIDDPSAYFTTTLYTGDGTDGRAITNSANAGNFQPDWLWYKERSSTSEHRSFDSSRGASKRIEPNNNNAEATDTTNHQSFDSNGFTIGNSGSTNENTQTYVAWQWIANGGTTSSNTDGSITSTVQANTTAGFSIVLYGGNDTAGATVGHGLGKVPKMIMVKNRSFNDSWIVYNEGTGNTHYLQLDTNVAKDNYFAAWNNTSPTSSVFSLHSDSGGRWVNNTGDNYLAYCFAEIQGYSKFGSYTGNGNADGPFVYTGFKPAWVMYKRTDTTGNWLIFDNERTTFNLADDFLQADLGDAEATSNANNRIDMVSNGFKHRGSGAASNASSGTYIYMAFAEHPFVSSKGVPVTAK